MLSSFIAVGLVLALPALAQVYPLEPSSTTVVEAGANLTAEWKVDSTGEWTDVEIQLMTGDNLQMIALETLATGIDGTTTSTWTGAMPVVTPNAMIYFLQFSHGGNLTDLTWTTRFTIAGPDGSTTPPTNSTVYNGVAVQWGTGTIVSNDAVDSTSSSSTSTGTVSSTSANASTNSSAPSLSMSMPMSTSPSSSSSSTLIPNTQVDSSPTSAQGEVAAVSASTSASTTMSPSSTMQSGAGRVRPSAVAAAALLAGVAVTLL